MPRVKAKMQALSAAGAPRWPASGSQAQERRRDLGEEREDWQHSTCRWAGCCAVAGYSAARSRSRVIQSGAPRKEACRSTAYWAGAVSCRADDGVAWAVISSPRPVVPVGGKSYGQRVGRGGAAAG